MNRHPEQAKRSPPGWRRGLGSLLLGCLAAAPAWADGSAAAAALRQRHEVLQEQLRQSPFRRPLHLVSSQSAGDLRGEVFAVLEHPFDTVGPALQARESWCEVLILHLNIKQCLARQAGQLSVRIGKKYDQPLADTFRIDFDYRLASRSADYLQVALNAAQGPLGTHDYRILFEALPLDDKRSFIHLSYSYSYGMAARLAMQGYLSTLGRGKIGFSVVDHRANGQPVHVGNMRGVVERNTMRYFLAIEAYLGTLSTPPAQKLPRRLHDWFAATERYAPQLHEIEEAQYVDMKLREMKRQ